MVTTHLLLSIQDMEKGQLSLPGCVIEGAMGTVGGIMDMSLLQGRNGAKIGHHHGSRMNGEGLFSLE